MKEEIAEAVTSPFVTQLISAIASKTAIGLAGLLAASGITWVAAPHFASPEEKLSKAIYAELEEFKPDRRLNVSLAVYQYQDNHTYMCLVPTAAIYPVGVRPKVGYCASTLEVPRDEMLATHKTGRCVAFDPYNTPSGTAMRASWELHGFIAKSSCPVMVDGELWGHVAVYYLENNAWVRVDGEDGWVNAGKRTLRMRFNRMVKAEVEELLEENLEDAALVLDTQR